jgi:hypothetical protein
MSETTRAQADALIRRAAEIIKESRKTERKLKSVAAKIEETGVPRAPRRARKSRTKRKPSS